MQEVTPCDPNFEEGLSNVERKCATGNEPLECDEAVIKSSLPTAD